MDNNIDDNIDYYQKYIKYKCKYFKMKSKLMEGNKLQSQSRSYSKEAYD